MVKKAPDTGSRIRIRNTADAYAIYPKTGDHWQSFNLNPACRLGYLKIRKMWLEQERFIGTYFGADPDPYSVQVAPDLFVNNFQDANEK